MEQTILTSASQPTFTVKEVAATATEATLMIEPLEQGYGHTVGNALRRVLLTSLPGFAITKITVSGADHQFSTVAGVTEDIVDLSLNLKQVRVRATATATTGVLRLKVKGAKTVTAADITCEAGFEIVNPDQHIAVLAKDKTLEVEMKVEGGLGYVVAPEDRTDNVGEIRVDALFSPVVQVSYKVEATRVGSKTNYDRIVMKVQTDGTISPLAALQASARILVAQFSQVYAPVVAVTQTTEPDLSPEEAEVLRLTVEELDLPTRIANALRKGGFATVGDLSGAAKITVAKVKNLGEKSVDLINDALAKKGVSLGD